MKAYGRLPVTTYVYCNCNCNCTSAQESPEKSRTVLDVVWEGRSEEHFPGTALYCNCTVTVLYLHAGVSDVHEFQHSR